MQNKQDHHNSSYKKFALMLAASFVVMYGVMFLNVDTFDHVFLSHTRAYMTILMVAPMALLKLLIMGNMYKNKRWNAVIAGSAVIIFIVTLLALRNQTFIGEIQYMKAMIPHHSSAIMVSEEATLEDPEAQKLAKEIIEAQKREIAQMKAMMQRLENQD